MLSIKIRIRKILVLVGFMSWMLLQASGVQGAICYVNASAKGKNDGTSWADAYTDLQSALNTGVPSEDQIWVAAGTYKPTGGTDHTISYFLGYVPIYGGFAGINETTVTQRNVAANKTILSGNLGSAKSDIIVKTNFLTGTLDGFTISGGTCGLYSIGNHPTIANCTFSNNSGAYAGAGIFNSGGWMVITNCTFINNTATNNGGGVSYSSASGVISHCIFSGNSVSSATDANGGGGLYISGLLKNPTITQCIFSANTVNTTGLGSGGGGLLINSGKPTVTNCVFVGNTVNSGYYIAGGGAILNAGSPTIINCTITGNKALWGGGIYEEKTSMITNCILWADSATHDPEGYVVSGPGNPTISYCDIQGSNGDVSGVATDGGGNIDKDPQFVSSDNAIGTGWFTTCAGLALNSNSPCAKNGTATGAPLTDIVGLSWTNGKPAIGAYQYNPLRNFVKGWELY